MELCNNLACVGKVDDGIEYAAARIEAKTAMKTGDEELGTIAFDPLHAHSGQSLENGRDLKAVLNYSSCTGAGTCADGGSVPVDATIRDARPALIAKELDLFRQGFTLVQQRTSLTTRDFHKMGHDVKLVRAYFEEMKVAIQAATGAQHVEVMSYLVRDSVLPSTVSGPFKAGTRGVSSHYASVVHTDFAARKAEEKIRERGALYRNLKGKYMLINAWRNISEAHPVLDNALACCDAQSIDALDFLRAEVPLDTDAAETAEQYHLTSTNASHHRWYYFPAMEKHELLLFTQYDSDPCAAARFCFHTSFADPSAPVGAPKRESIEVRAIAFLADEGGAPQRDWSSPNLTPKLAQGASRGFIEVHDIDATVDRATLSGMSNEAVIRSICSRRGVPYVPAEWTPGPASFRILSVLRLLRQAAAIDKRLPLEVNGRFDHDTVQALQAVLVYAGHLQAGSIDGVWKQRSESALEAYLRCLGYDVGPGEDGRFEAECVQVPCCGKGHLSQALRAWTFDVGFPVGVVDENVHFSHALPLIVALQRTLNTLSATRSKAF